MKTFFFMVALACRSGIVHGTVPVVTEDAVEGVETVGTVGAVACSPALPAIVDVVVMGTPAQELTPRLPISVESSGIPARVAGVADDVGVDDEATLVEPEPHIPVIAAVAGIPEVVDNPEVAEIPDGIAAVAPMPDDGEAIPDAVAGGAVPFSVTPPPS
jgi:hypothetical protein